MKVTRKKKNKNLEKIKKKLKFFFFFYFFPKVKILMGVVMNFRIGFKNEFIIPITIPIKTIICQSELISIPKNSEYPGIVLISTLEIK